jgi:hypothetical protein
MQIELKLHIDEVNAILQTLGNLPTSSGAWPLVVNIKQQAEAQVPKQEEASEQDAT